MPEKWTGKLVGKMHIHRVSYEDLAKKLGVSKAYICMILNGKRNPDGARKRLEEALEEVLRERKTANA